MAIGRLLILLLRRSAAGAIKTSSLVGAPSPMHSNGRSFAFTLAFILGSIPVLAAALLLTSNSALAQNVTSSVSGTVTDISGAVVPKAKITLRNNSTGQQLSILTNGSGAYTITNIQPGTYTIQAEAQGFQGQTQDNFLVDPNIGRQANFSLK